MNRIRSIFSVYLAIGLVLLGAAADSQAQNRRNEREVRDIVRSLNSKVDDFQYSLNYRLQNNSVDRDEATRVSRDLRGLQDKVRKFQDNLDNRRENADDVRDLLGAARNIDQFLYDNRQNRKIDADWQGIKDLLERLASSYGVYPDWNGGGTTSDNSSSGNQLPQNNSPHPDPTPRDRSSTYNNGLRGTYQLDAARSENTADIVAGSGAQSDSQRQELEDKLRTPEQIAIDIQGNQVTLATSNAAPVTFFADGRDKTENVNGRTLRLRATMNGQALTVSSLGGETDYTITFVSEGGGRTMKVSRRVTTDYLDQTVFAESFYNKTDSVARLGINGNQGGSSTDNGGYSTNDTSDTPNNSGSPSVNTGRRGEYIVPSGTIVTGTLDNEINTKISQNNDRFKMTVQSPDEFRGATIEGYISGVGRSGKVTGRSNVTLNFERITLRNGQTYDFAGFLQSVKDASGKEVKVDTEGTAKGESQTKETAKRGGIGAGIGAVIGAIAGGGKGAAIGAIIGGGAGTATVAIQNNGDLQLGKGSSITVQSSSPRQ